MAGCFWKFMTVLYFGFTENVFQICQWLKLTEINTAWKVSKYSENSLIQSGYYGPEKTPYLTRPERFLFTECIWKYFL